MSYIKYGVTTKIKLITENDETDKFIKDNFNLDIFDKKDKNYYLNPEMLTNNLVNFRKEVLEFTNGNGDSLNNCEAYCLNTDINELLKHNIVLCNDNEKYYFSNNSNYKFDTDQFIITDNYISLKLFLIPIFWDVNKIEFENFMNIATFISKLVRTSTSNILKGASFFVVV